MRYSAIDGGTIDALAILEELQRPLVMINYTAVSDILFVPSPSLSATHES